MSMLNLNIPPTSIPNFADKLQSIRFPHNKMTLKATPFSSKLLSLPIDFETQFIPYKAYPIQIPKRQISCVNSNGLSDADLASDFSTEIEKMNTQLVQREEAMRKSRALLFKELCQHVCMKPEEVKKKWLKMNEDDKLVMIKDFVSKWGANFHPLSARSVKEMVDQWSVEDNQYPKSSSSLLPGLRKLMGFSSNER